MTNEKELFIDTEVRIRLLENIAKDMKEKFIQIDQSYKHLDNKMSNQFFCMLAIVISLFGGIIWQLAKGN